MALFLTPEEHAANPPSSWVIWKNAARSWNLSPAGGPDAGVLATYPTRKQALEAREHSFYVALYEKEARWFRGEPITGWKPYSACAERLRKASEMQQAR